MALNFKTFDWRSLKKYTDPKASGDLNAFLEKLPQNAGQTVLIAAGIAWAMAGALGLYTTIQMRGLTELRGQLKEAEALTPIVPVIANVPVDKAEVDGFIKGMKEAYKDLNVQADGATVVITSGTTSNFGEFREAISHVQNGGSLWRVTLKSLCVGRECDAQQKLAVALDVNKVSVENPTPVETPPSK